MPLLTSTTLQPNFLFRNRHFNTLYRFVFSRSTVKFERERITTPDADFIDLDKASVQSDQVILAVYGLEGSSKSGYIQSLTEYANKHGFDVIVMNLRGCSGEPNRMLPSYHSGTTKDLRNIITHVIEKYNYKAMHVVGYSLGGNITLKLLGELKDNYPQIIQSAVAVSVPCDLEGSSIVLNQGFNKLYQFGILQSLLKKAKYKLKKFPNSGVAKDKLLKVSNFHDFDEYYTAPIYDFSSAKDYYLRSSSKAFIKYIRVPTLMIAALDDSFLSESCYPFQEAKESEKVYLLTPKFGGHVGFYAGFRKKKNYWLEKELVAFIRAHNFSQ